MSALIQIVYLAAAILFIIGLKRMSSPLTARSGIVWAGWGMLCAVLVTFLAPDLNNYTLMISAIVIGAVVAWYLGKRVAMTDMPQVIAIYNGMGGGAAAGIAAVALLHSSLVSITDISLAMLGAFIGASAFTGSLIAFMKLQGWVNKPIIFIQQQLFNSIFLLLTLGLGIAAVMYYPSDQGMLLLGLFFTASLLLGVLVTLPVGGANMPIVISLFNAFTGLAVGLEGFAINNPAMIVAGTVVGSAGFLLTQLMAKAMNRSIADVLFKNSKKNAPEQQGQAEAGSLKPIEVSDAAVMLAFSKNVIIVPGYGMAVSQAQHKIWELAKRLEEQGVNVKFAIHPVAGRMPGHMNVLLAEAGVPYDKLFDLEQINEEFANADVALVIGANDVVNPVARTQPDSPIYGMPILNVYQAKNVIVIKRGQGAGFSGVENGLFLLDNTRMLYGDGQAMAQQLIQEVAGFKA